MKYMGRPARMARHHKRHKAEAAINLVSVIDMENQPRRLLEPTAGQTEEEQISGREVTIMAVMQKGLENAAAVVARD